VTCKWCAGTGKEYVEPATSHFFACPDCGGTGKTDGADTDDPRADDTAPDCGDCVTDAQDDRIHEQFPECFSLSL